MAKIKCRSCDICGAINADKGLMVRAKSLEDHMFTDYETGRRVYGGRRWVRIDFCISCFNKMVRYCRAKMDGGDTDA